MVSHTALSLRIQYYLEGLDENKETSLIKMTTSRIKIVVCAKIVIMFLTIYVI